MQPARRLGLAALLAALGASCALHAPAVRTVQAGAVVQVSCEIKTSAFWNRMFWVRQRGAPGNDSAYELLASWDPQRKTYRPEVTPGTLEVRPDFAGSVLKLKSAKPEDSGAYFCMTIGTPEVIFWDGAQLSVVDTLPTTAEPTRKTTPSKRPRPCRPPSTVPQKGLPCGLVPLSLLLAGTLVLLVSLGVSLRLLCLRRRERLRLLKQFSK